MTGFGNKLVTAAILLEILTALSFELYLDRLVYLN
jgi:hypothetical protein